MSIFCDALLGFLTNYVSNNYMIRKLQYIHQIYGFHITKKCKKYGAVKNITVHPSMLSSNRVSPQMCFLKSQPTPSLFPLKPALYRIWNEIETLSRSSDALIPRNFSCIPNSQCKSSTGTCHWKDEYHIPHIVHYAFQRFSRTATAKLLLSKIT